ncbi:MAG: hypothetical protein ACPGVH_00815 [Chitinophagales bacterium]
MNNTKFYFFFFAIVCTFLACTTKPDFPPEPKIEFLYLSKNQVNVGDTLSLVLSFEDGDGNLGKDAGISANCGINVCDFDSDTTCFKDPYYGAFLIDMRDSCFALTNLPNFEPNGKIKAVSGELILKSPPIFCKLGACTSCTTDTLVYKIVVRDLTQNLSNEIFSDTIYINCN